MGTDFSALAETFQTVWGGAQPEECGCGHFALYRFIFYDDQHFAAVFRHIVQEELYFSVHIGYTKVAIYSVGIKNK